MQLSSKDLGSTQESKRKQNVTNCWLYSPGTAWGRSWLSHLSPTFPIQVPK